MNLFKNIFNHFSNLIKLNWVSLKEILIDIGLIISIGLIIYMLNVICKFEIRLNNHPQTTTQENN
jgi:hypothetical protein